MLPLLEHEGPAESIPPTTSTRSDGSFSGTSEWSTVLPLFRFNLKLASKRGKMKQTIGQILSNILIIAAMRLARPDVSLPATKYMNVFDPMRECIPAGTSVSFICDAATYGDCDAAYNTFARELAPARIPHTRFDDPIDYRASLKYGGDVFGAHLVSPTAFELDVPPGLSSLLSQVEVSDGKQCRLLSDPACAPVQLLRSCAAAVEYATIAAMSGSEPVKFRLFPQKAGAVNGITDSFLVWLIPLYLSGVLLNLYNFALIEVVSENEGRHRDYLIGWGISRLAHFFSWLLSNLYFGLIGILVMVYGLVKTNVFHSEYSVHLFVGMLAYFVSLLSLAYVLSLRIKSTRTASNVASFTDMVFNITSLSAAAIHNRVASLVLAAVPTVPFFILLRAVAYDQGRTGNPYISSATALIVSVLSGVAFASVGVVACLRDTSKVKAVVSRPSLTDEAVVHLRGVTKRYPEAERDALHGASLRVKRGEIHTLIGGNGAGKTTLINALLGIHGVDSAEVFSIPAPSQLALCLQEDAIWQDLRVRDHLDFFTSLIGGFVDSDYLKSTIDKLALSGVLDQDCSTLSGGQKRRFSFLLAMLKAALPETQLVILDEPTTGVDVDGRRLMWELVNAARQRHGAAVLLTTHYLDEAQALSDRVTFLVEGEVKASGSVVELQSALNGGWFLTVAGPGSQIALAAVRSAVPAAELLDAAQPGYRVKIAAGRDEDLLLAVQTVESLDPALVSFSVESVSLDNLFMALHEQLGAEQMQMAEAELNRPRQPKWTDQTLAMARIRVLPKVTNFKSFFSYIVFPALLIGFSLVARQLRMFGSSQQIPDVSAQTRFESLTLSGVFNSSGTGVGRVPVVGDWRWPPLPPQFETFQLPQDSGLFDYLAETDEWFPFAIDSGENMVYVNPTSPRSLVALLAFFAGQDATVQPSVGSFLSDAEFNTIVKATVTNVIVYAVLSLSVLTTQCGTQVFDERRSFIKRLAQIQGMQPSAYWTGSVVGHFLLNFPVIVAAPVTAVISLGGLITDIPGSWAMLAASAATTTVQLVLFGYIFVFLFKSKEQMLKINSMFTVIVFELLVVGVCTFILSFYRSPWTLTLFVLSFLIPPLNIAAVISKLAALHMNSCSVVSESCVFDHSVWSYGVWVPIAAGVLQIIVLSTVLIGMERRDVNRVSQPSFDGCAWGLDPNHIPHDSVKAELDRVMKNCDDDILFVKLWHNYARPQAADAAMQTAGAGWAVRDLTLGVKRNEVLGLLGKNGAGKTTALADLLAVQKQTAGYAGVWPGKRVGFCPQSNPLWDALSGLEHVRFYASLRGCWTGNGYGERLLASVGILAKDINKPARSYSGGMKRRLCLAIAIVGSPDVLILDEPTAGVDVAGKREIWAVLKTLKDLSCSVLITTHSLEEADSLCSRISIMDAGRLVRVGTTEQLKQAQQKLVVVLEPHPSASLVEEIRTRLGAGADDVVKVNEARLEINTAVVAISWVIDTMIQLKRLRSVKNYSLAQLSLEEVFLKTVGDQ